MIARGCGQAEIQLKATALQKSLCYFDTGNPIPRTRLKQATKKCQMVPCPKLASRCVNTLDTRFLYHMSRFFSLIFLLTCRWSPRDFSSGDQITAVSHSYRNKFRSDLSWLSVRSRWEEIFLDSSNLVNSREMEKMLLISLRERHRGRRKGAPVLNQIAIWRQRWPETWKCCFTRYDSCLKELRRPVFDWAFRRLLCVHFRTTC